MLGHLEKQNAKNFILGQNFPNPYIDETTIPVNMIQTGDVTLDLYDLQGRKVATIHRENLLVSDRNIILNMKDLNIPVGNYAYQTTVKNTNRIFRDCKITVAR